MSKTISTLYDALFETLQAARAGTMDIERVKAINDTAQVIVNAAKVEVDHMKVTGGTGSGFISASGDKMLLPGRTISEPTGHGQRTVSMLPSGATITRHKAS